MTTKAYLIGLAAGAIFWIAVREAIHAHLLPRLNSEAFYVLVALTWNALSWRRIGRAYVYHLAPYVTMAAVIGATWGAGAGEGQYAFGGHPPTVFDVVVFWVSLPLLVVWPVVAVMLCARKPK